MVTSQDIGNPARELLTEVEAGEILGGISRITLQSWRSRGEGPPYLKIGRLVRYRRQALTDWLETRERNPLGGQR